MSNDIALIQMYVSVYGMTIITAHGQSSIYI